MKLKVKSLNGSHFEIDADPTMSVLQTKDTIKGMKGWSPVSQKLIYKGKILADEKLLSDYNIDSTSFLVCMVTKPKLTPETTAASSTQSASLAPSSTSEVRPIPVSWDSQEVTTSVVSIETPMENTVTDTVGESVSQPTDSAPFDTPWTEAHFPPRSRGQDDPGLQGPQFEASLAQLLEMGFPRQEAESTLRASFGNVTRAIEYLMNGIPSDYASTNESNRGTLQSMEGGEVDVEMTEPAPSTPLTTVTSTQATTSIISDDSPLAALRQHPQFNQLRRVVQENPQMLSNVLAALGQGNPSILQAIDANRGLFVQMMNEPIVESTPAAEPNVTGDPVSSIPLDQSHQQPEEITAILRAMQAMPADQRDQLAQAMGVQPEQLAAITQMIQTMPPEAMGQMMESMMSGGMGMSSGVRGHEESVINLTQDELDAVERLTELGFPQSACLEAYLACDKNEQLAANYLFNNPADENDE